MKRKRNITVVTGSRAEYGLLVPVMRAIRARGDLNLQVVVTGMHLLRRFGSTKTLIEQDGWPIDACIPVQGERDDLIGLCRGFGRGIQKFSEEFFRLRSDVVLVLGDRVEIFAAATAATVGQFVLAHIHGGDIAPGVQDDAFRHAITKLAHIHFPATEGAKQRILQMGEAPRRVFLCGSPSLDGLCGLGHITLSDLSKWIGFDPREEFILISQHPAGGTARQEGLWMKQTLMAAAKMGMKQVVLYPNSDPGFSGIINVEREFCRKKDSVLIRNLPRSVYVGLLKRCRLLLGNSSSGLLEAGFLGVPAVNIGPRQSGRERAENVIDVDYGMSNVLNGIRNAMTLRPKKSKLYGNGRSGQRIAWVLSRIPLTPSLRQKQFNV